MFKSKVGGAIDRLEEENWYAEVANELGSGKRKDGVWAQALAEAEGDEIKAKGLYISSRVQSMKDEATVLNHLAREKINLSQTEGNTSSTLAKTIASNDETPERIKKRKRELVKLSKDRKKFINKLKKSDKNRKTYVVKRLFFELWMILKRFDVELNFVISTILSWLLALLIIGIVLAILTSK